MTEIIDRKDVGRPNDITMRNEIALGTIELPSAALLLMPAIRAGLGTVRLIDQLDGNTGGFGLVLDIPAQLTVRPLANLLLALAAEPFAVSNVPDITDSDSARFPFDGPLDNSPADFVQHIPALALDKGQQFSFTPFQSPPFPAVFLEPTLGRLDTRHLLVPVLVQCSEFSDREDNRLRQVSRNHGMDLSQVQSYYLVTGRPGRFEAIVDNQMPVVATFLMIVDQSGFFEVLAGHILKIIRQPNHNWLNPSGSLQAQHTALFLYAGVLPDRCPEPLALVGEMRRAVTILTKRPGRVDRLVERLLGRLPTVRMKRGLLTQTVDKGFVPVLRHPNNLTATAIDTPMPLHCTGVDTARLHIQLIGQLMRYSARENLRENQKAPLVRHCLCRENQGGQKCFDDRVAPVWCNYQSLTVTLICSTLRLYHRTNVPRNLSILPAAAKAAP